MQGVGSEEQIINKIKAKIVKCSLEIILLKNLKENCINGYNFAAILNRKYGVLLSSGTVYSFLYSVERLGLVKSSFKERARCYEITEKGERMLAALAIQKRTLRQLIEQIY